MESKTTTSDLPKPTAEGPIASRSFFDSSGNVLPVISAFDKPATP